MFNESIFVDDTIEIASGDMAAIFDVKRVEFPADCFRKCRNIDALGYVNGAGQFVDVFQRTLNTVENTA